MKTIARLMQAWHQWTGVLRMTAEEIWLAQSTDIVDLEQRIRRLERQRHSGFGC